MKKWMILFTALLFLPFGFSTPAKAATSWNESVTIYGAGLENDKNTQDEMSQILGTNESDKIGYVYSDDTQKYIGVNYDDNILFSSIRIMEKNRGGLNIKVDETHGKITDISKETYQNALITAGITDADVVIAAPHDVTGESALTGIYKAYEVQGSDVNTEYTKNAQDELETISDISAENENVEGFSEEQLNKAITEVKVTVINLMNDGDNVTEDNVRQIIDEKLADNGLEGVLSEEQKNQIVIIIMQIKDSGLFSSESANHILDSSKNLIGQISDSDTFQQAKEKAKDLGKDFKDYANSDEGQGVLSKIKSFFQSIVDFFKGLFS